MKRILGLVLALILVISSCALGENIVMTDFGQGLTLLGDPESDEILQKAMAFMSENASDLKEQIFAQSRYAPVRAYKLEWPADKSSVNEKVAEVYGEFTSIVAVLFEVESYSSPITLFVYAAVGIGADGDMAFCASPDKVISKTYDPKTFEAFRTTVYKLDGIERSAVTVYLPDANYDQLEKFEAEGVNSVTGLIEVLEKAGAVAKGTHVLAYDGNTLNLSREFGEAVTHTGTAGEYLMMGAVVNTLISNLGLKEITVKSDGKTIETGHAVYDKPLTFFEANK